MIFLSSHIYSRQPSWIGEIFTTLRELLVQKVPLRLIQLSWTWAADNNEHSGELLYLLRHVNHKCNPLCWKNLQYLQSIELATQTSGIVKVYNYQ